MKLTRKKTKSTFEILPLADLIGRMKVNFAKSVYSGKFLGERLSISFYLSYVPEVITPCFIEKRAYDEPKRFLLVLLVITNLVV